MANNYRENRSKFTKMLDEHSPFDNIELGLDTKYVDVGVGYDRDRGTTLRATIDLNSWGKTDEEALIAAKVEYQRKLMQLDLERKALENQRTAYSYMQPIQPEMVKPTVEKIPEKNTKQVIPKVKVLEKVEEEKFVEKEMNYNEVYGMSAKAFLDDEEF